MSLLAKIPQLRRYSLQDCPALWRGGLHGFERETFRLHSASVRPSASRHRALFPQPSALAAEADEPEQRPQDKQIHRFAGTPAQKQRLRELLPHALTLDFSDQQPELVSPPHSSPEAAEADILLLLRFVAAELQAQKTGEILWAFSQPPLFRAEDLAAIRIADFGPTADAAGKEAYRQQLALRYGKAMQSWTGIHYNFSLDPRLFQQGILCTCHTYVRLARNLWRHFWILPLLYGCSPGVSPFYTAQMQRHFAAGGEVLAPPPAAAVSLRSYYGYGYRSSQQQMQYLDYSGPCEYWQSIEKTGDIDSPFFRRLGLANTQLIQDSRELYTPFRLKQLHCHGNECWDKDDCLVDYLELRMLDIDPLFGGTENLSGIYLPSVRLAHLLLLYCTLCESPPLERSELLQCAQREQEVLGWGRELVKTSSKGQQAQVLLAELGELTALLGLAPEYGQAVTQAQDNLKQDRLRAAEFVGRLGSQPSPERLYQHSADWSAALQNV